MHFISFPFVVHRGGFGPWFYLCLCSSTNWTHQRRRSHSRGTVTARAATSAAKPPRAGADAGSSRAVVRLVTHLEQNPTCHDTNNRSKERTKLPIVKTGIEKPQLHTDERVTGEAVQGEPKGHTVSVLPRCPHAGSSGRRWLSAGDPAPAAVGKLLRLLHQEKESQKKWFQRTL